MLQITIPGVEFYDNAKNEFMTLGEETLILEHSLISISKWEAKYHKSFLAHPEKTNEEMLDYIRCMTQNNVSQYAYDRLTKENYVQIKEYMENPMSATHVGHISSSNGPKDTITSELIYYWMVALQIPFECQYWHLNRLFALIEVCGFKNNPNKKKLSRNDILRKNNALNAVRRSRLHSKG